MASSANTQSPYADLPSEKIAQLRQAIRANTAAGYDLPTISKAIEAKYGVTAKQVLEPSPSDFGRGVAQGVTLGHADEIAGLYAKLTGKSYTEARDAMRNNDAEFKAIHPWLKMMTEAAAAGVPGMAAAPLAGVQKGAMLANTLRGAGVGTGIGAIAGEGNSNAPSGGGVGRDAALSGAFGGVLGAAGGAVSSKLATAGNPLDNAAPVAREVATQLPANPAAIQAQLLRQEQLAPGTVVLADQSPQMQKFIRVIGADPKTATLARDEAQTRLNALLAARRGVGQSYDQLQGVKAPADQQITAALVQAGRRDLITKGQVDLGDLHQLRSALVKAGSRKDAGMKGTELKQSAADITGWLSDPQRAPWIKQTDADYAFLTDRTKAAQQTLKTVANSSADYAANRAVGRQPASLGGSISVPQSGGAVGTTIMKMIKPNVAKRAQAVSQLLLSPQRDPSGLDGLMLIHDALLQSQSAPAASLIQAGVTGAGVQGANSLFAMPSSPLQVP